MATPQTLPTFDRPPLEEMTGSVNVLNWFASLVDELNTAMTTINNRLASGGL